MLTIEEKKYCLIYSKLSVSKKYERLGDKIIKVKKL
jgi:hypothetical protein